MAKDPTPLNPYDRPDMARAYVVKGRKTYCIVAEDPTPRTQSNPKDPLHPIVIGQTLCGKGLVHLSFDTVRGLERRGLTMHAEDRTLYDAAYPAPNDDE